MRNGKTFETGRRAKAVLDAAVCCIYRLRSLLPLPHTHTHTHTLLYWFSLSSSLGRRPLSLSPFFFFHSPRERESYSAASSRKPTFSSLAVSNARPVISTICYRELGEESKRRLFSKQVSCVLRSSSILFSSMVVGVQQNAPLKRWRALCAQPVFLLLLLKLSTREEKTRADCGE